MLISEDEYLVVGKIIKPVGLKGEVKIYPETDDINRFERVKFLFIKKNSNYKKLEIEKARIIGKNVALKFRGVDSIDSAGHISGNYLYVERKHAIKLPEGSYYYYDLCRCMVKTVDGKAVGKMVNIIALGEYDVYVVNLQKSREEVYIPAVKEIVKRVDIENQEIIIEPMEGLIEDTEY